MVARTGVDGRTLLHDIHLQGERESVFFALAEFDSTSSVAKFLPGAAADGIIGSSFYSSAGSGTAIELLSRPAGAAMMVAYIVALALIGRFTTFKRDIS